MKLLAPEIVDKCQAGQFVHLGLNMGSTDPLLRRPFSIYNINRKNKSIFLLYRVVGKGTKIMSNLSKGDKVDILGPLGNSFTINPNNKNILIIGGGMGIAPLLLLTRKSINKKINKINVLLGTSDKEELSFFKRDFLKYNISLRTATLNGSMGFKGNVVDLWKSLLQKNQLKEIDYIYTCGPEEMMTSIQEIAAKIGIQGECSMEKRMGCGIGVCLSCVCETNKGHKRTCKEGPVFSLNEVIFDEKS